MKPLNEMTKEDFAALTKDERAQVRQQRRVAHQQNTGALQQYVAGATALMGTIAPRLQALLDAKVQKINSDVAAIKQALDAIYGSIMSYDISGKTPKVVQDYYLAQIVLLNGMRDTMALDGTIDAVVADITRVKGFLVDKNLDTTAVDQMLVDCQDAKAQLGDFATDVAEIKSDAYDQASVAELAAVNALSEGKLQGFNATFEAGKDDLNAMMDLFNAVYGDLSEKRDVFTIDRAANKVVSKQVTMLDLANVNLEQLAPATTAPHASAFKPVDAKPADEPANGSIANLASRIMGSN